MTGIGGPGGVGPKGPPGLEPGDEAVAGGASEATSGAQQSQGATGAGASERSDAALQTQRSSAAAGLQGMDALAAEIAAGRLTPKQAVDYLVEAAGAQLDPVERGELREMLGDLFANDPHLQRLIDGLGSGG